MTAGTNNLDEPLPAWQIALVGIGTTLFFMLLTFPVAGDWQWVAGWVFVVAFALTNTINVVIINARNPRVLRNRSRMRKHGLTDETREAASSDRFIMPLLGIGGYGALLVPALGHRFGWYELPLAFELVGSGLFAAGLTVMHIATLQNSFASKVLDINQDQVLVDTGLYGVVRHPLYSGGLLMFSFMPIALGSLWGLIPAAVAALALVVRIPFEEEMLIKGMPGYADYRSRVPYRLIPGIY